MKNTPLSILSPLQTMQDIHPVKLDKNELPLDVSNLMKYRVARQVMQEEWNRYPEATYTEIESLVANYAGLAPDQVALGAGSAAIIANLLNYFAIQQKDLVILQPTYAMFQQHCLNYGIPFTPWYLNPNLEFDFDLLPKLNENSVLILTSPNNPVGNTIDLEQFESLLKRFPQTLIVLDNVYHEFSDTDFTPLLNQYSNLLILRSFSKAFPVAGIRLGYICAQPHHIHWIKKVSLNFSLNHFSLTVAKELLFHPEFIQDSYRQVSEIIRRRELMCATLMAYFEEDELEVFRSQGNFLLVRVCSEKHAMVMNSLKSAGIQVLDASGFPMLNNCIRISIGNHSVCNQILELFMCFFHKTQALEEFRQMTKFSNPNLHLNTAEREVSLVN